VSFGLETPEFTKLKCAYTESESAKTGISDHYPERAKPNFTNFSRSVDIVITQEPCYGNESFWGEQKKMTYSPYPPSIFALKLHNQLAYHKEDGRINSGYV